MESKFAFNFECNRPVAISRHAHFYVQLAAGNDRYFSITRVTFFLFATSSSLAIGSKGTVVQELQNWSSRLIKLEIHFM